MGAKSNTDDHKKRTRLSKNKSTGHVYLYSLGVTRLPVFTRCHTCAQVVHMLQHTGQLVSLCPGCGSGWLRGWFCAVFGLT